MNDVADPDVPQRVECPAAKDPAVRLFIGAAMGLGFAIYCAVDTVDVPKEWTFEYFNEAIEYVLHKAGPYVFGIPGVILAACGIRFLRRKLVADEAGIGYVGKEQVPWEKITELDASRLKAKGILTLHTGDGGTLKLCSWKLDNFKALVALIEQKVPQQSPSEP